MHHTLLILDEDSVAQHDGVSFHLNPARKHPENPVLIPGEPQQWDSLQIAWPATILRDPEAGLFRCWYHGLDAVQKDRPETLPWRPGYAESTDGIHWTKPELGFHTLRDLPTNRLGTDWDGWILSCVFFNPDRSDPKRRFLSLWKDRQSAEEPQMPRVLASSPDGKMWHREKVAYREPAPRNQMQDFWQVLHDPEAADPDFRYRAYSQYWAPKKEGGPLVRQIGMHHGPAIDALQDAQPPIVMAPLDGVDDELHFASVHRTGGNYLMLIESDRFAAKPIHGDLRLAVSSDGQNFRRVHPAVPLVATGAKGMWDENLLVSTGHSMLEVGDEIWIYYHGCPNVYTNWPHGGIYRGSFYYPSYLGLATLPRDRYGYALGAGSVTTRPIEGGAGTEIWINAEGSGIEAKAIDETGKVVAEGRLADEVKQSVYRRIAWNDQVRPGRHAIRVSLPDGCRLFSIGIENSSHRPTAETAHNL